MGLRWRSKFRRAQSRTYSRRFQNGFALLVTAGLVLLAVPGSTQGRPLHNMATDPATKIAIKAGLQQGHTARPPELRDEVAVYLKPGVDPGRFAAQYGLNLLYPLQGERNAYLFQTRSIQVAQMAVSALQRDSRVAYAFQNKTFEHTLDSFYPNDPYFLPFSQGVNRRAIMTQIWG